MEIRDRPREPLFRDVLGAHFHWLRRTRGERLFDVAARAGISTQYLSEIERGRKDPSSEMIEAVALALGSTVAEVAIAVGQQLAQQPVRLDLSAQASTPTRMDGPPVTAWAIAA